MPPESPSTVTRTESFSRVRGTLIRSIMGIWPMIAPVAMIASASVLMIAAGACPFRLRAYRTYEPTVDPFPYGNASTLPAIPIPFSGCPFSTIIPVSGSTPERNEMGAGLTRSSPFPVPFDIPLPLICKITPHKWLKMKI